jgi:hypothetical protein
MGQWSVAEGVVGIILQHLLQTDRAAARIVVASGLTTIELKDLIVALSHLRIDDELQRAAEKLGERLKRLNTKRNRIIHGFWTVEIVNLPVPARRSHVWNRALGEALHTIRSPYRPEGNGRRQPERAERLSFYASPNG